MLFKGTIFVKSFLIMAKKIIYLFVALVMAITACKYEPIEQPIKPDTGGNTGGNNSGNTGTTPTPKPCSPDTAYFKNDILPMMVSNCSKSGCHDAISKAKDVQLTDYQTIIKEIKPFNLSESKVYKYSSKKDPQKIMPPPPNISLTTTQLEVLAKWILQGAKNNSCDANTSGCDIKNVTFTKVIKPILDKNCVGCHGGTSPSANIQLADYQNVAKYAKSGSLYGSISHDPNFSKMPKGGAKLNSCDIDKVKAWIDAGYKND
jgi:hypothetical protein